MKKICSIEGCGKYVHGRGWCNNHYRAWQRNGDPTIRRLMKNGNCSVPNCDQPSIARALCENHYSAWRRHGDPTVMKRARNGEGHIDQFGYRLHNRNGKLKRHHVFVAEKALGKPLPPKAKIHHVNQDRADNRNSNLVICPNQAYHNLLHQRMRAYAACGNPNWRKCYLCKIYDSPNNLHVYTNYAVHDLCRKSYNHEYHSKYKKS